MEENALKTPYARAKEERELAIYKEFKQLMSVKGAMIGGVEEALMIKYGIHSPSTIWKIRRKVEKKISEGEITL